MKYAKIEVVDRMLDGGVEFYKPKIPTTMKVMFGLFVAFCVATPGTNWLIVPASIWILGMRIDKELVENVYRRYVRR